MQYIKQFSLLLFALLVMNACKDNTEFTPPDSSFGLIYTKILTPSCGVSGCHDGSSSFPTLSGELTYQSIVSVIPQNVLAVNAGLEVVKPNDPDNSFLYQKLIYDSSAFQFGSPMPLGGLTVTDNQIEFIKQWIEAGAPETGHVADRTLVE